MAVASFQGAEERRRAACGHVTSPLSLLQGRWQPPALSPGHHSSSWQVPPLELSPTPQDPSPTHPQPHTSPAPWGYSRQRQGGREHLSHRVCQAHPKSKRESGMRPTPRPQHPRDQACGAAQTPWGPGGVSPEPPLAGCLLLVPTRSPPGWGALGEHPSVRGAGTPGSSSPTRDAAPVCTHRSTFGTRETHHAGLASGSGWAWGAGAAVLTSGALGWGEQRPR